MSAAPGAPARVVDGRLEGAAFLDNPNLRLVLGALDGNGEDVRVVGGALRNALMGEPVHDVDLATTALPEIIVERAKAARLKPVPTGIDHGTITVVANGEPFEVTTLREDVETHGRHATVLFGRDFRADALRRDFTFNALSLDAHRVLHDYTGGVEDAAARRVRFIGDAATRIREDYLRILRLFRFHAAYGSGDMDAPALHAAIVLRAGLAGLSRERVHAELMKLLAAPRAAEVVADMTHAGILADVIAGAPNPRRLARLKGIEAAQGLAPDPVLRLGALCVQVVDDAQRLRERLRLSNAQEARLSAAAQALAPLHGRDAPPAPGDLRGMLFDHGRRGALDALMLAHAESRAAEDDPAWRSAYAFTRDTPEPRLPFSGADLLARGLKSGPALGAALKRFQAAWIRAGFPKEPETLNRLLEESIVGAD
ncbi:MAG: tRNA nucleotidyltransferase [Hyphomicrobiales bacterium]|nr:tRNA nucleotidyltransferase [Hyphomicrobiales bacterium]